MLPRRILAVPLAIALIAPLLAAIGGALPTRAERLLVGLAPGTLDVQPGDVLAGGRVLSVNQAAGFAIVETRQASRLHALAASSAGVRYVAPDPDNVVIALGVPSDPHYSSQYALERVRAAEAWDVTKGATKVVVAVVDSGVDASHPDLDRILAGADFTGERTLSDGCGHGTHVAGVATATTGNGVGVAGMAQASLLPVKVVGKRCTGSFSALASGITWAADRGADVISVSLGCVGCYSRAVEDAIAYATHTKGALVVAAAGNFGPCTYCVSFPATLPDVVAVGCTDERDGLCWFSSTGPEVEIAAPGESILSTYPGGKYAWMSGTSMSTPHVSGAAALLLSLEPSLTPAEVRARLKASATDLGPKGRDVATGWGLLDAAALVGSTGGGGGGPQPPLMEESFDGGKPAGWTLTGLWRVGGGCLGAASAPASLQWNVASSCTYETGARVSGAATFTVDLRGKPAPVLSFRERAGVERYPVSYDRMSVEVSVDGGKSWTTLLSADSRDAPVPDWTKRSADLTPYRSAATAIRFSFDSVDEEFNAYPGWAVDDVRIE